MLFESPVRRVSINRRRCPDEKASEAMHGLILFPLRRFAGDEFARTREDVGWDLVGAMFLFVLWGLSSLSSHALPETLALPAHAEPGVNASGFLASSGNPSREEPQGLLAHGKDHCQWCRNDEQVAAGAGTGEPEESLGVTRSTSLNRLVRTRMPGGVGRAVSNGRPYPISPDLGDLGLLQ